MTRCRLCQRPEGDDPGAHHGRGVLCPLCGYWRDDAERRTLRLRAAREAIATWREARRHRAVGLIASLLERARLCVRECDAGPEREALEAELLDVHEGPPPR